MRHSSIPLFLLMTLILSCCDAQPQRELFNVLLGSDHQGPILLDRKAIGTYRARYRFDELVRCNERDFTCPDGDNTIVSALPFEDTVTVTFAQPLVPGERQVIDARVTDMVGNTLSLRAGVWGHNPRVPKLLINEFVTKGTSSNPDRIELLVTGRGNLAGITLYDGMSESFDSECIFPALEVQPGDRIVIEYSTQLRGEHAIEIWGGETGLGANNGVISLYDAPGGTIIDAVLYSNRTSSSDTLYGGFGTRKVADRAKILEKTGQWDPLPVVPECAVTSTNSTATRSICRTEGAVDLDTNEDWHVVPTGKASFGTLNSSERFEP